MSELTETGLSLLLERLGAVPGDPASAYQDLRLRLYKYFVWKGCPGLKADRLADETIDRVASKLETGVEIESIPSYSCETARYVFLEFLRSDKEIAAGDELPEIPYEPEDPDEGDPRIPCLRECLSESPEVSEDRKLILGYYGGLGSEKLKTERKRLAKEMGLSSNALKVRACRLRIRLEKCVTKCLAEQFAGS